jgi:predicted DNA-binding transcriptional regulator YafY
MRADRLLSILMLLQSRGQLTARELADELEVSERTIYRDVEALSMAGVPLYCSRGPGGGIALLDSYRTDLTGLTAEETRALFMLSIPAPLAELGVGSELRSAILKLAAALPEALRPDEARARQRIHIDSVWWFPEKEPLPQLAKLHQAVWQDRWIEAEYRWMNFLTIPRRLAAYGLVAKAGIWYLVWESQGRFGAYKLTELASVQVTEETFQRREDFELKSFWEAYCQQELANRPVYTVKVRFSAELAMNLLQIAGRLAQIVRDQEDHTGWLTATIPFESLFEARERLLALGGAVEVLAPRALRLSMIDYAEQILKRYQP